MAARLISFLSWAGPSTLVLIIFVLILKRGLHRRLPLFVVYFAVNAFQGLILWLAFRKLGFGTTAMFYTYYISQGFVTAARGLAIFELCNHLLRAYRGIWELAWRLLALASAGLIIYAGISAIGKSYWIAGFVLSADRGIELTAAVSLLLLLGITAYYRVQAPHPEYLIAAGFAFYSLVIVVADSMLIGSLRLFAAFAVMEQVSYAVVLLLWIQALRKPLAAEPGTPLLLDRSVYAGVVPRVNQQLNEINNRLLDLLWPKSKDPPASP